MSLHVALRAGMLRIKDAVEDRVRLVRWAITAAKKREQLKMALHLSQEALTGLEAAHEIGKELEEAVAQGVPDAISTVELYTMATDELRQAEAVLREFLEYGEVQGGIDYHKFDEESFEPVEQDGRVEFAPECPGVVPPDAVPSVRREMDCGGPPCWYDR